MAGSSCSMQPGRTQSCVQRGRLSDSAGLNVVATKQARESDRWFVGGKGHVALPICYTCKRLHFQRFNRSHLSPIYRRLRTQHGNDSPPPYKAVFVDYCFVLFRCAKGILMTKHVTGMRNPLWYHIMRTLGLWQGPSLDETPQVNSGDARLSPLFCWSESHGNHVQGWPGFWYLA